jgi:pyruvate formate lyase activating enzyme
MYANLNGSIKPKYSNQITTIAIGRIEDVPVLHFYPDTLTLLLGTAGCNFDCDYCLNYQTARGNPGSLFRYNIASKDIIRKAKAANCRSITFYHNEVIVSFPLFLEIARLAKRADILVGCATNAYFTEKAARELAQYVDFMSISLKSLYDEYYQRVCQAPSANPVKRNIEFFHSSGIHVEVNTPITEDIEEPEVEEIARFLSGIDANIPYVILRLLPEYKMENKSKTPIDKLKTMKELARQRLNHVFIGNIVGPGWLDTRCPDCGLTLVNRINNTGCGAITVKNRIQKNRCPDCGAYIPIIYDREYEDRARGKKLNQETTNEALGILSIDGQRIVFDFRTGLPSKTSLPLLTSLDNSMASLPYPGDAKTEADLWAIKMALELVNIYPADLVTLLLAQASFSAFYNTDDYESHYETIFRNISLFLKKTGYEPVICGLGNLENIERFIDLENTLNSDTTFHITSGKYAFINESTFKKIRPKRLRELERFTNIIRKEDFLKTLTRGFSKEYEAALDDYVVIANKGAIFKGLNSLGKKQINTFGLDDTIPLYTTIGEPKHICEISDCIKSSIKDGKKVALILVEGAGNKNFGLPFTECSNRNGKLNYGLWQQYYTISTGKEYTCSDSFLDRRSWPGERKSYPFSGRFFEPLPDAIGHSITNGKSLTVGNRSMITHVCLGADISLECYCCYSHHYGSLAVVDSKLLGVGC